MKYFLFINFNDKTSSSLNNEIIKMINLFKLITRIEFNDDTRTQNFYIKIQNEIIKTKTESIIYRFYSKKKENVDEGINYFKEYNDHLIVINDNSQNCFIENNETSIKKIEGGWAFPIATIKNYEKLDLKKIKFDYPEPEFSEIINIKNKNLTSLKEISGFIIKDSDQCQEILQFINDNLPNLKKFTRIQFTEEENDGAGLFKQFFEGLKRKSKISKITVWYNTFIKGRDYKMILDNFPNIRRVLEDYDSSGFYDVRFEIDKIFTCNAEQKFNGDDLNFINQLLRNNILHKKIGKKYFSFTLTCDLVAISSVINYLKSHKQNDLLDSIHTIKNYVSGGASDLKFKFSGLKKMNYFNMQNENENLIKLLCDINYISLIRISSKKLFIDYFNFVCKAKPKCICCSINIDQMLLEKIMAVPSVEILIVNNVDEAREIIDKNKMNIRNIKIIHNCFNFI